jgi:hypothetical protein
MSTDFSIKPLGAPAAPAPVRPVSPAVESAVVTELPPSQSTTAAGTATNPRNDTQTSSDPLSHQVVIDRDASAIIYQVVDQRTLLVVNQYPDEAMVRRRAYFHALDLTKTERQPTTVRNA